jgi:hypothetical protein
MTTFLPAGVRQRGISLNRESGGFDDNRAGDTGALKILYRRAKADQFPP